MKVITGFEQKIFEGLHYSKRKELEEYLDAVGIGYSKKDSKQDLIRLAKDSVNSYQRLVSLSRFAYLTSSEVRSLLGLTEKRLEQEIHHGMIEVDRYDKYSCLRIRLHRADKILSYMFGFSAGTV